MHKNTNTVGLNAFYDASPLHMENYSLKNLNDIYHASVDPSTGKHQQ